jgi:predicted naringenin-chalcone synthase
MPNDLVTAHINRIATGVPLHDAHALFVGFARGLIAEPRARAVFDRLIVKSQIEHRFSVLAPGGTQEDASMAVERVYTPGAFPSTGRRMQLFEKLAPVLVMETVAKLELGASAARITHVIVTSCTGMVAPGLDLLLVERLGLSPSVERTMVGFMGCFAAINALKLARHIVRSAPESHVLVVNLELCSLHLQETPELEQLLSFLVFGDGCAACIVSAEPEGLALDRFHAALLPGTRDLITWKIRDLGFDMFLSGGVPGAISQGLGGAREQILDGAPADAIDRWAVHPGGRSVLDSVERGLGLASDALAASRSVLKRFGNMSSATVMFVLESVLGDASKGERGCAMSFGPGLTAETMLFHKA